MELNIRVRPNVASQQLATGCPESEQVMAFRCVALLSTEARSDWSLKRVSWSWSGERAERGGAIGGTSCVPSAHAPANTGGFLPSAFFFNSHCPNEILFRKRKRTRNETKGFLRQLPHTI